jgi:hypothetical protein
VDVPFAHDDLAPSGCIAAGNRPVNRTCHGAGSYRYDKIDQVTGVTQGTVNCVDRHANRNENA